MKMYIFIDKNAFLNNFPMKPAVACQSLSKLVCSLDYVSEQYVSKI